MSASKINHIKLSYIKSKEEEEEGKNERIKESKLNPE